MTTTVRRHLLALTGSAVALALVLAGCSAGNGSASVTGGPSSPSTSPSAGATASSAPTSADSSSAGPSDSPISGASPSPSSAPLPSSTPSSSMRSSRCLSANLAASLTSGGGGAAGSVLPYLVLTNTGTTRCTLQGRPGVSFVGDGTGVQLGAAGDFDLSTPHGTVTLEPGGAAHAPLRIARAGNYDSASCDPQLADGLRIYPPGETRALFVATTDLTACRAGAVHLITVQALLPGAS